jgi:hypothetical protein
MRIAMRGVVLAMVAGWVVLTAASAEPAAWHAMSKTAMSITGDIMLDDYRLTFADGKSLDLEPYELAREGDWSGSGDVITGDVFKIAPAPGLKLQNGNLFCAAPASYVVLWTPGESELTINVYSGDAAPTGTRDVDALCATYSYEER